MIASAFAERDAHGPWSLAFSGWYAPLLPEMHLDERLAFWMAFKNGTEGAWFASTRGTVAFLAGDQVLSKAFAWPDVAPCPEPDDRPALKARALALLHQHLS